MSELFSSSLFTFCFFLVIGSVIVYLILKFDTIQRQKLNRIMASTRDVKPLFEQQATGDKLHTIKKKCSDNAIAHKQIAQQLDELVANYDKGKISLPDYCSQLNRLLAMVA
ncbi:hypothetical protein FFF34_008970 [Inquilinus sp. KBS0705]|nr:hypothetical protein FFF34_008970 [Inquilinus sp. KBS0705]